LPAGACVITPGTQLPGAAATDQARTTTPAAALALGASHLVFGRAVVKAADPVAALQRLRDSLGGS